MGTLTPDFVPFRPAALGCARPHCPELIDIDKTYGIHGRRNQYCSASCRIKARQEYDDTERAFNYLARVLDSYHRSAEHGTPLTLSARHAKKLIEAVSSLSEDLDYLHDALDKVTRLPPRFQDRVKNANKAATELNKLVGTESRARNGTSYEAGKRAARGNNR